MKKIFMILVACGTMAATLNSCNDAEANKKAQEADWAKVDEEATAKVTTLTDAATAECDATVLAAAQAEVTRLAEEAAKTPGKKPVVKAKPKPVVKTEPKKEEPKKGFGGAVENKETPKGFGGQVKEAEKETAPKKKGFGGQVKP